MDNTEELTISELTAKRDQLTSLLEARMKKERDLGISQAKELIRQHKLTQKDLFDHESAPKSAKTASSKLLAKYREPGTDNTWNGHGRAPKWFDKNNKEKFLIVQ